MENKEDASIYAAKTYFALYEYLKNNKEINNSELDPVEYLKDLNKHYYVSKGRYLTDEEIIAYEVNQIQDILISKKINECKYKDEVNRYYNGLIKSKVFYKKEDLDKYKSYINIIYCLLDKFPPFLDVIYEKCSNIQKRKDKVIKK